MIKIIADNILSPLGETTEANVKAVRQGMSALREHHLTGMPESFVGSVFEPSLAFAEGLIRTITTALTQTDLDASSSDVIFVISSTKGNIADFECIGASAEKVCRHFGNPNRPLVVSNACISGLSAQIAAMRLLRAGYYRYAIVAGMDVQGKFIVSGFQSFKALSPDPCRPFDGDRCGLNLGEAAACIVLQNDNENDNGWVMEDGSVRNDACHISNPSRTGEGSLRAIQQIYQEGTPLTCISAHGTATLYNDEMEAAAIDRAGLKDVPTFSLKGYYGHTMGAAGILETIITLHAVDEGWIPATKGFEEAGTCHEIHVTAQEEPSDGQRVMKLLSGFGGCNGAAIYSNHNENDNHNENANTNANANRLKEVASVALTPADVPQGLTALYKDSVGDYPKFYKMDPLCKLGFLAVEQLLKKTAQNPDENVEETRAVVLFCKHGSMAADRAYEETICNAEEYFPSPAVFVYTLSNIVTGEIAIRHHYYGETSCYILEEKDESLMQQVILSTLQDQGIQSIIGGWIDYADEQHYEAELSLYERN